MSGGDCQHPQLGLSECCGLLYCCLPGQAIETKARWCCVRLQLRLTIDAPDCSPSNAREQLEQPSVGMIDSTGTAVESLLHMDHCYWLRAQLREHKLLPVHALDVHQLMRSVSRYAAGRNTVVQAEQTPTCLLQGSIPLQRSQTEGKRATSQLSCATTIC